MIGAFVPVSDRRSTVGFIVQENGCWEWVGCTHNGYGITFHHGKNVRAHRYYYEREHGPIPEGLQLDHLCRNRKCVRPGHLEAVTRKENILRGIGPTAIHARKTHCPQGHPYTAENTYRDGLNRRYCVMCQPARQARRGKRRKNDARTHLRATWRWATFLAKWIRDNVEKPATSEPGG